MTTTKRDLRVDFCRGLALLIIFWDHLAHMTHGNSVVFRLTPQHWGFSDAAELFVYLSGYVFGIVYGRVLVSQGFAACQRKALHRVGQIYAANTIALLSTCALVTLFVYGVGTSPGYLNEFFEAPAEMFFRGLALHYLPWNFGILPLYMVILAAMPPMLVLLRKNAAAGLLLSFAVYLLANFVPWLNLPRYHGVNGQWSFNPFAWQFLFTLAAALGMGALDHSRIPRTRTLLFLALAVLATGPALRIGTYATGHDLFGLGDWKDWFTIRFPYADGRVNLSPYRLIHFLAVVYVGSRLLPRENRIWLSTPFRPLIHCGQHSLTVFSMSVVLSYCLDLTHEAAGGGSILLAMLLTLGMGVMLLAGSLLAARKRSKRETEAGKALSLGTSSAAD